MGGVYERTQSISGTGYRRWPVARRVAWSFRYLASPVSSPTNWASTCCSAQLVGFGRGAPERRPPAALKRKNARSATTMRIYRRTIPTAIPAYPPTTQIMSVPIHHDDSPYSTSQGGPRKPARRHPIQSSGHGSSLEHTHRSNSMGGEEATALPLGGSRNNSRSCPSCRQRRYFSHGAPAGYSKTYELCKDWLKITEARSLPWWI